MQGEVETRRIRSHCSFPARVFVSALIVAFCACLLAPDLSARALADETATQFRQWLAQTVWPDAQKRGVSRETFDKAFADMRLALDLPDLQRPGSTTSRDEQAQLEFQDPRRYFVEGQLSSLSKAGVGLLARWGSALSAIEQLYGVPKEIIVAIWGRESHFGRVAPKRQALRVLATQAFMGRRRALYYPELLAALVILEEDHVPAEMLLSSWAGAMGQPQLLPSKFLRYAVDGDGDGKRDIWRSAPDSLASIANYLREHGWVRERGWGFETRVPGDVSCTFEGPRRGKPMREWARLGLTRVDGTALPSTNASALTYLLMPVGRLGPAFLVSENFYVLKEYNESDLYALFVGHLADRMRNGPAISGAWSPIDRMRRGDIRTMQQRLVAEGHDVGEVDGLIGFATRTAVGEWQTKRGRAATCFPDAALLQEIR